MLVFLVLLECCFLFAAFSDSHFDKPGNGSAWFAWCQHPSPETEAAWNAEKRQLRIEGAIFELMIWSLIVGTGVGLYYVVKKQRTQV